MGEPRDILGGRRYRVEQGDAIEFMRTLPDSCVDLVFFSPPYTGARLYLEGGADLSIVRDAEQWAAWMVEVVRECCRVCTGLVACVCDDQTSGYRYGCSPYLLMADLVRAGFNLRRPCIYRRSGIPGSGGPDWFRCDHEPVICVTRPGRLPWSEVTACGHTPVYGVGGEISHRTLDGTRVNERRKIKGAGGGGRAVNGSMKSEQQWAKAGFTQPALANPGTVVDCDVGGGRMGSPLAHKNEAPFPEQLPERFVRSFCPPDGIVFDPFCGSGTTPAVAVRHNRRALACDLRQSQVDLTLRRIGGETPLALFADA